ARLAAGRGRVPRAQARLPVVLTDGSAPRTPPHARSLMSVFIRVYPWLSLSRGRREFVPRADARGARRCAATCQGRSGRVRDASLHGASRPQTDTPSAPRSKRALRGTDRATPRAAARNATDRRTGPGRTP